MTNGDPPVAEHVVLDRLTAWARRTSAVRACVREGIKRWADVHHVTIAETTVEQES